MTVIETVETKELRVSTNKLDSNGALLSIPAYVNGILKIDSNGVGIGIDGPNTYAGAVLACNSSTRGFLPPRMTTAQRNTLSATTPQVGTMVYDTNTNKLYVFTGAAFEAITSV